MSNVTPMKEAFRGMMSQMTSGDEPPHNGEMEARVKALEEAMKNLPTKADFEALRADVKTGVSDLRAEMHKSSIDIHKWMIGTVIGLFLGFGGLFLAMSNGLKQQPAPLPTASQPQPIIIAVPQSAPAQSAPPAAPTASPSTN